MHYPSNDWYDGPVEQMIPAAPGWLLAMPVQEPDGPLRVELHPIVCWAHIAGPAYFDKRVAPVIALQGAGTPYIGDGAVIAPGQDVVTKLALDLDLFDTTSYVIATGPWHPDHVRRMGWRRDDPQQVRVNGC